MSFTDISYLELWQTLCSMERDHLCNFSRRHHGDVFCEIVLNLDHRFRRKCRLKEYFIWSSGSHFVRRSITFCEILVEGIMKNNSVRLF